MTFMCIAKRIKRKHIMIRKKRGVAHLIISQYFSTGNVTRMVIIAFSQRTMTQWTMTKNAKTGLRVSRKAGATYEDIT